MAAESKVALLGRATPWGRWLERRVDALERKLNVTSDTVNGMQESFDKTVYANYDHAMNIDNGVNGKLALSIPTECQYVSSTGLFEVTVSASGLVLGGGTLGVSFESDQFPSDLYFDIPAYGVVAGSSGNELRYVPFAGSRSTIISTRPGVYNFSLYAIANTAQNANSIAYLHKCQLSVKAV